MTSFLRRLSFAVAAALAAAPLAFAPVPAAAADVVAVVPFAVPGSEKIQNMDDATGILTTKLTERGITPKTLPPTDRLGTVANAAQICAQTGATGILVPTARTEQGERKRDYILVTTSVLRDARRAAARAAALRRHARVVVRDVRRQGLLQCERSGRRRRRDRSGDRARAGRVRRASARSRGSGTCRSPAARAAGRRCGREESRDHPVHANSAASPIRAWTSRPKKRASASSSAA